MTQAHSAPGAGLPVLDSSQSAAPEVGVGADPLTQRVRGGVLWNAGGTVLLRLSNIAVMAVVARIVAPEEVGIFALAMVVQAFLTSMAELGVASAIARTDLDIDKIAPTVATISLCFSLTLAAAMAAFAEQLAMALGSAEVAGTIRILAINVALIGVFAVPGAQILRDFRQDVLFWASVVSFAASSAVLVLLALLGDGASAFAWSRVAGQLVTGLVIAACLRKVYLPGLDMKYLMPLLRFGIPLAMANLLSQVLLNVDYVFVSQFMSTADVGIYMLAFNVSNWSAAVIATVLNSMVLPAFSTIRRDGGDTRAALAKAVRTVALFAFPIAAFTATFGTELIVTIYGDTWAAGGPVLTVLSIYGAVFVLNLLFANIIISVGRTGVLFAVQALALVALLPALALGVTSGGLVGVGAAHIAVILAVTLPVYLVALRRSIGAGAAGVLRALVRPASGAIAAAVVAGLATSAVEAAPLRLVLGGLIGAVVFTLWTLPLSLELLPQRRVASGQRGVFAYAKEKGGL
ncbi:oligosaccharide flippase family protein [Arthrobacter oryzae]|uniref:oligosaccharide flippase family protein n=1 Tax=Arthrobacter oryzae TaxID=409290 RepID=UPI0028669C3F|nr:oligosaccharide flippase family protein [Arthrobacter oryzae]MDR6504450.1 PST family polysaccharide transporter [Arthrobacter oryzae]